jgi:hypothetical protein
MQNTNSPWYRSASILSATLLLLAAICFGGSRDFGVFVLGLFLLPMLLVSALSFLAIACASPAGRKRVRVAAVILITSPFAAYIAAHLHDEAEFLVWGLTHPERLSQAMHKDQIVTGLDDWGMAGSSNFSYLISDTSDPPATLVSAERWRKRMRLDCEIVRSQKMWPRLYIVTTFNCPFDGIAVPE